MINKNKLINKAIKGVIPSEIVIFLCLFLSFGSWIAVEFLEDWIAMADCDTPWRMTPAAIEDQAKKCQQITAYPHFKEELQVILSGNKNQHELLPQAETENVKNLFQAARKSPIQMEQESSKGDRKSELEVSEALED